MDFKSFVALCVCAASPTFRDSGLFIINCVFFLGISCMAQECSLQMPEDFVLPLLPGEELKDKYRRYLFRDYVEVSVCVCVCVCVYVCVLKFFAQMLHQILHV